MSRATAGFAAMLAIAMAMSTFSLFALAVVASDLEAEFGLSKLELGLIGAANTGVGGLFAPFAGRLSDVLGGRLAVGAVLLTSALTSGLAALSQSYGFLLFAMAASGISQGWGNPATNKAIATGIAHHQRGLLTGIKQSGVQLATFGSGFAMPFIARSLGWRAGLWMVAGISLVAMGGLRFVTALDEPETAVRTGDSLDAPIRPPLTPLVYQVAAFGFLLGSVGGGLGRFLPLFAEEDVGFTPELAGFVFGVSGLVAIPTRIVWGVVLDRGFPAQRALVLLGIGSAAACALLVGAAGGAGWLLWAGTVLSGLTIGSWNTAANLSMIQEMGGGGAGRATGVLLFGFLLGLTVGSPLVGWSIDHFGAYEPAWLASAIACLAGATVVARRLPGPARYS